MFTFLCPNGHISKSAAKEPYGGCATCGAEAQHVITEAQGDAITSLSERFRAPVAWANVGAFDLPNGWVLVELKGGFQAGVSPEGQVSS